MEAASASAPTTPRPGWRRLADDVLASPSFFPQLAAIAICVWFAADEAGFEPGTFYPGGLFLLGLLTLALLMLPAPQPSRRTLVALGLLAAYAAWCYLSIGWADEGGRAWDGANRGLLYVFVLALFALWPPRPRVAALLLGLWALAIAAVGLVELLRANGAADPVRFFFEARLVEPAGYVNANVALWFSAFWPCLVLAGRRELLPALRGLFLGAATLLCGLALLGQSRGWLLVLPPMALIALALVPGRARTLLALLAVGVAMLAVAGPLLDVYDGYAPGADLGPELARATRALLAAAGALVLLGALAALLDRRGQSRPRAEARADRLAGVLTVAALVAAVAAFAVAVGNPISEASDYWSDFKRGGVSPSAGETRLTGTAATDRYDFWRVGWEMFEDKPLTGYGSDNFQHEYLVRGKGEQQPRHPHSLEIRVLAQTGLVGALLLGGALLAAALAAASALRRRRADPAGLAPATAAAALLVTIYWLLHGSVDWLWEFPGLSAPAFAALGLAIALGDVARERVPRGRLPLAARLAAAVVALLIAASFAAPWISGLYVKRAAAIWPRDPDRASELLDRAATLNPLSPVPDLAAGAIAVRQGRLDAAQTAFLAALDRDPRDAYANLLLGAIASERGDRRESLRRLRKSAVLAPRYDAVQGSLRAVEKRKELTASAVSRLVGKAANARIGLGQ